MLDTEGKPRASFPMDFTLADEHHQAFLLIDEGEAVASQSRARQVGSQSLVLTMTNRSGSDMEWLAVPDGPLTEQFHHLSLTFRPGVLSEITKSRLGNPKEFLGADEAHWRVAQGKSPTDGSTRILFAFVPRDEKGQPDPKQLRLPASQSLKVRLCGISAAGDAHHGLTRVEAQLSKVKLAGQEEKDWHPRSSLRHCHLSIRYGGRSDLPIMIGFEGEPVILADGKAEGEGHVLTIQLYNPTNKTFGQRKEGHDPVEFELLFENHGPWALWKKTGKEEVEKSQPVPKVHFDRFGEIKESPRLTDADPLMWRIPLPQDGISKNASLKITVSDIVTYEEGQTNLTLDAFGVPGFGRSRTVLPFMRSRVTPKQQRDTLNTLRALVESLRVRAALSEQSAASDQFAPIVLTSAADPLEINAEKTPIGPWLPKVPNVANLSRQKWEDKGVTARAVSRRFVLMDMEGTVRPVMGGRLLDPMPKPPTGPQFQRPFLGIGEFLGSPILFNPGSATLCRWASLAGEWQSLNPQQVVRPDQQPMSITWVGDSWFSYVVFNAPRYAGLLTLDPANLNDTSFLAASVSGLKPNLASVGGTAAYPLILDVQGGIWGIKPPVTTQPWAKKSLEAIVWEQKPDCPPGARRLNDLGVLIDGDGAVFRYQSSKWECIRAGGARWIGGTWRNPMVIGSEEGNHLYRLEDPE